ncbi:ATP synthase F1 subcomplex delta subunit [Winogradskyella eximia]|uniref:ATP synthase subunit delta n=1 Tax=Winogradskyella eximia TaxID=262006 RepID=A0A3D9HBN5_9FLAO|nr:ATP synthase F1 subunit delta [Winogradskyella eximia]RED46416.1 ATP synthase F1 subcomplex delta subunit [Winogradskyella eximia]|tara:strand:- start:575 stop:1111 length:537 start_codon:yes stop_codon:yes gene_type:complete
MSGSRAAIRYAKAVLSLATDQKSAEAVNSDMKSIANAIAESEDLNQMLQSPVVRSSDKKAVLLAIFKNSNITTNNLLDTLIANKRVPLLNEVALSYIHLYDELRGSQVASVTTAIPLTEDLKTKVLAKVKELTGKDAEVENIIDESILGGFILRVGDIQYNASIANKLDKLKREFTLN